MPPEYEQTVNIAGDGFVLLIQFACHFTQCFIDLVPKNPLSLTPPDLLAHLTAQEICVGVNPAALTQAAAALQRGEEVRNLQVAQGFLPETGKDAYLEYKTKPFSFEPDFNEDTKGQIDFHITHLFENVKAGEVIAQEHPMVPGKNGQTVTGKIIPTASLRAQAVKPGLGVSFNPETREYTATLPGRVMCKDGYLSVTEEFMIEGDVDYKTGHIDFVGFVHVRGDVLDGFNVTGRKGVKVYNNIGNSRLTSGGDIDIGGMTGRDQQAQIRCQGRLQAGYLYNVDVECADDIYVKREIMHSNIKTNGTLYCHGRIVGGSCLALAGIEVATLGSEFGIKTFLCAGIDYHLANTIHQFMAQVISLQQRLLGLQRQLEQNANPAQLPPWQAQWQKVAKQKEALDQKLDWIYANMSKRANAKINVLKELHPGTLIQLGQTEMEFKQPLAGPKSLIEVFRRELQALNLSPLSRQAHDLEQEFLERTVKT